MTPQPLPSTAQNERGFSLIEVAIAVSILAVCLVALIGLLPAGMSNFRKAMDTTISAQISQRIMQEMEQAEFNEIIDLENLPPAADGPYIRVQGTSQRIHVGPKDFSFRAPKITPSGNEPTFRFFDDQGNELVPVQGGTTLSATQLRNAVYTVNVRVMPRAEVPTGTVGGGSGSANMAQAAVAQITVEVARNPANTDLSKHINAQNLIDRTAKETKTMQIFTYHGLIGANQGV